MAFKVPNILLASEVTPNPPALVTRGLEAGPSDPGFLISDTGFGYNTS
jgi:hypothetical protein